MTDRKLFGTNELVNDYTKQLEKIETLDGGWTVRYIDKSTGQQWLKYTVDPDRGYHSNLMQINPSLTTDQLIEIAFSSSYPDEVSAAAYRLNLEEQFENKEYRQELLTRLQRAAMRKLSDSDKVRLKTIIQAGQLLDPVNHRNILGKHFVEIEKDAKFFRDIADKAKSILRQLDI